MTCPPFKIGVWMHWSLNAHLVGDDVLADVWRARAAKGIAAASVEPHA